LVEEAVEPAAAPEPEGVVVAETVTEATTPAEPAAAVEAPPAEEKEPVKAPAAKPTAKGDDLRRIVGVGPRVVAQFQRLGITTYAQLAALDVDELRTTLDDAGLLRLADPGTWPEQAQLAAAGQWDELEALQATLNFKGVRLS
jgi:predicted flap endonuclease-1-like 5' DNA nuclease